MNQSTEIDGPAIHFLILGEDVVDRAHDTAQRINRRIEKALQYAWEFDHVAEAIRLRLETERIAVKARWLRQRSQMLLEEMRSATSMAAVNVTNSKHLLHGRRAVDWR